MRKNNKFKVLAVLVLVAAGLWWLVGHREGGRQRETVPEKTPPQTIMDGGVKVTDFTLSAGKVHDLVDRQIQAGKGSGKVLSAVSQEVPRANGDGKIRWHVRQLQVNLPVDVTVDSWLQRLAAALKPLGAEVLSQKPDVGNGQEGLRVEVCIRDQLGGEALTLITDKLFVVAAGVTRDGKQPPADKKKVTGKGQLALLIDDFGYTHDPIQGFAALGRPVTFAVLPNRPFSQEAAAQAVRHGQQVIVHMPMEALSPSATVEPVTVNVDMSDSEIQATARRLLDSVPGAIGVNNHQGSKATADQRVMNQVMDMVKSRGVFFVDSRTNGRSVAVDTARRYGIATGANEIFLDNVNDVAMVKQQLRTAAGMAQRNGSVIIIGHARMTTLMAVQEMLPELDEMGVKLVFVSQLVR